MYWKHILNTFNFVYFKADNPFNPLMHVCNFSKKMEKRGEFMYLSFMPVE